MVNDSLLTISQASEYLNLSISTIKHWVSGNKITFTKINRSVRFRKKWLDEMIENNKRERK